jgi:hypothetical protein
MKQDWLNGPLHISSLNTMLSLSSLTLLSWGCGLVGSSPLAESAGESVNPVGQTLLVNIGSRQTQYCFDKFSLEAKGCSGIYRLVSGATKTFEFKDGQCSAEGLKASSKVGDQIEVKCVNAEGKSCFSEGGLPAKAIDRKAATAYGNRVWGDKEDAKADFVQIRNERSCSELFNKPSTSNCETQSAKLTGSGLACFNETDPTSRAECLIKDAALEVYTTATLSQVKAGTAKPDRCYVNIPGATDKEPKNLFIYKDTSGKYVGARASGDIVFSSVGAAQGYFTASFQKFFEIDTPTVQAFPSVQSLDVLYPKGEPDPESGAWQMGQYVVARFVAKEFCASEYINRAYPAAGTDSQATPQSSAPPSPAAPSSNTTNSSCQK